MKFVKAYVELKLTGENVERFLNLCVFHDIIFKTIEDNGDRLTCTLSVEDFYGIKDIIKKTGVKVVISKRYGLPFLVKKILKKKGILVGTFLLCVFLFLSQYCLWEIEIYGTEVVTTHQILDVMEKQKVFIGMPLFKIDYVAVEESIRETFSEVVWCSASREENHLLVYIREKDPEHGKVVSDDEKKKLLGIDVIEGAGYTDLVANRDIMIKSMVVRKGLPVATEGEVKTGEVLVTGSVPVYADDGTVKTYLNEYSSAQITVSYQQEYGHMLERKIVRKEYTGREGYGFIFNGKEYSFASFTKYDREQINFFWTEFLPITLVRYKEYADVEYKRGDEEMENILTKKLEEFMSGLTEKGIQIIAKDVKMIRSADFCQMHGTLTLEGQFDE